MDLIEKGRRVLVIGGAGFIGSHVVDLLAAAGASVTVLDNLVRGTERNLTDALRTGRVRVIKGDILDRDMLGEVVEDADDVLHLAALWLLQCEEDPRSAFEINVAGTFNVLEACRAAKVKRLVFSSSASVYGDAVTVPMSEAHPFNNKTVYGATKIAAEEFCRIYRERFRVPTVALRYMNVYGPRQDYQGAYVSVVMQVLDRIDLGLPPVIFGDGTATYDFVYVGDVARANVLALAHPEAASAYNVGSGVGTTVNELVRMLLNLSGSRLTPEYRPQEQVFVQRRIGSVGRAARDLCFRSEVGLEDGLQALIEWRRREIAAATQTGGA